MLVFKSAVLATPRWSAEGLLFHVLAGGIPVVVLAVAKLSPVNARVMVGPPLSARVEERFKLPETTIPPWVQLENEVPA